jgi:hypothetical protein
MKKLLIILLLMASTVLTSSCQKELPDAIKNVEVSKGDKGKDPTPTPTPDNPPQQDDIPNEEDNPWPGY